MGLTLADGIYDFFREATKGNLSGKKLLMLGKQHIALSVPWYYIIAARMKVNILDVSVKEDLSGGIDSFSFFYGLGFSEVHAMDISDYEGADIVFDLNSTEMIGELREQFDYIVDGGTLEHIFNIGHALKNIAKMLKIGGKVYHYLPASNWINHGFFTISPSLLNDFYDSNGFYIEELNLILFNDKFARCAKKHMIPDDLEDCLVTGIDYRLTNLMDARFNLLHEYKGSIRCIAQKRESKILVNPIQRHWYDNNQGTVLIKALNLLKYHKSEIAIWGMGKTAMRLLNVFYDSNFPMEKIQGFFATKTTQTEYHGFPVLCHEKIYSYGIKVLIIASTLYEDEIYQSIRHLEKEGIEIIRLKQYGI